MVICVSRWGIVPGWSIYRLPDFIASVVQVLIQFAAGVLRAHFCIVQGLAAILSELLSAAPGILASPARLFTGAILIGPGASSQTRCEKNNHGVSHASGAVQILCQPGSSDVRMCEKKPAGWNKTGGQATAEG